MKSRVAFTILSLLSIVVGLAGVLAASYGLIAITGASGSTATVIGLVGVIIGGQGLRYASERWRHAFRQRYVPPQEDAGAGRPVPSWERLATELLHGLPWYTTLLGVGLLLFPRSPAGLALISVTLLIATRFSEHVLLARRSTPVAKIRLWFWFNRIKLAVMLAVFVAGLLLATGPSYCAVALIAASAAVWLLSADWVGSVHKRDRSLRFPFL
jgi:hypothetical protein